MDSEKEQSKATPADLAKALAERLPKGAGPEALQRVLDLLGSTGLDDPESEEDVQDMAKHKFWSTQPVPRLGAPADEIPEGPLEPDKKPDEIPAEPYPLPAGLSWVTIDLDDATQKRDVYDLLTNNYVEDYDATFRFDYSADFIEWALKAPGYIRDWHIGIRDATGRLVGFIAGIPLEIRVRAVIKRCTEVNFICIHKSLRSQRLAPVLIQEVTRRTHQRGIFQAIYTGGSYLPTPVSRCRYYHRSLNPRKLVKLGFSAIPRGATMARLLAKYRLPEATRVPGLREMAKGDLKQVARLLRTYLARADLAPMMSNKEVEYALLAGRGRDVSGKREGQVTWTYVVEDPKTHRITDMFSFYSLPSTALAAKPPDKVNAAYLWYYATSYCPSCTEFVENPGLNKPVRNWQEESDEDRLVLKARLKELIGDALVIAQKAGFDVLNALSLQDNKLFLDDMMFGLGDGYLHYYLYNYGTKPIIGGDKEGETGSGVGLVML